MSTSGKKYKKNFTKQCVCMICSKEFLSTNSWAKVCGKECFLEKQRINSKRYRTLNNNNKVLGIERQKKYVMSHPEKVKAQKLLQYSARRGYIIRPDYCEECFISCKPQGHHSDYSKPLSVSWLCPRCHKKEHLCV
jgi:hypothetical protein